MFSQQHAAAPLVIERYGRPSLRSRAVAASVRAVVRPYMVRTAATALGPKELRRAAQLDRLAAHARPARGTWHERVRFDGFDAEWVHGPGVSPVRAGNVVLYLHGGGFISCGLNTHRRLTSQISAAAGVPALSVDYRMYPAVRFEQEVDDCVTAYRGLLDEGRKPGQVVVAGDSAGGHLAFATVLKARDMGLPLPAGIVGLSPILDMDLTAKQQHANAALDPVRFIDSLTQVMGVITAGLDLTDPLVSPVHADLAGLPPVLLSVGSTEVMFCDNETMAHRLAAAGVPTTLQIWQDQLHVFQMFGPLLPESRAGLRSVGRFIQA
ncbi:MAG: alpha/beta hydrolase, partial [Mycobacteriaceae bacterium]|nr:alpha/beta hydrolase [Mycobacteriaceae bacterium]